jgi:hypothetical protein
MGVLSFMAIPKLWKRSREVWTETQGTLVESYLKEGKRESSVGNRMNATVSYDTYDVRLKYRYQAGGRDYSGDEKALRQPEDDEKWEEARAVRESYKAGDAIAVFYNPDEPRRSRLTAMEPPIEFKLDLFFVFAYLIAGAVLWRLGRRKLRSAIVEGGA